MNAHVCAELPNVAESVAANVAESVAVDLGATGGKEKKKMTVEKNSAESTKSSKSSQWG